MPSDKPKLNLESLGTTGLPVWGGRVYDEALRDLAGDRGRRIFREMSEQDPIIGGIMLGVEFLARQVNWSIKPASDTEKAKEVAEFVDSALTDMNPTFGMTLSEILSMLVYGWSWLELLYKRREGLNMEDNLKSSIFDDGKVGWGGWQIRSQETLFDWEWGGQTNVNQTGASFGPLTAMRQQDPVATSINRVPRSKSLHFVTRSRRENPEGVSFLRNAYRSWYMKKNIETIEAIGVERDLAGLPVLWAPQELFSVGATPDQKALFARLQKIVTSIKRDEQEGILMPMAFSDDGKNALYKLELLATGGDRQFDTSAIINRYDDRIAMSMLADFMTMGHNSSQGSYALASSKTGMFSAAMSALLDIIADEINDQAFPKLVVLNGYLLKDTPTLQHGKVEAADMSRLADYLNALNAAGMTIFPNPTLEKFLIEYAGMPGSDEIPEAGEWPLDPNTGLPIPPDPSLGVVDPATGLPQIKPPAVVPTPNPGTDPQNKIDKGARRQAPRAVAIRRETARTKAASEGDEPEPIKAHTTTRHHRHFVPLSTRVTRIAPQLRQVLKPDEYADLLDQVVQLGKFTKLKDQYKEAIRQVEGASPVQS